MKKLLLLCFILLSYIYAYPQSFTAGVVGGFANTDVNGFDVEDGDEDFYRLGVTLGGFVNRSFNDRTSVQLELLYSTKGTSQPGDSTNNFVYYRLRLDYVEIPVLYKRKLHLFVNKQQLDKLEMEVGPSYAVLTGWTQESNSIVFPFAVPFHKNDFLLNLGFNYYFTENFSLDVRFANSIVPIRPNPGPSPYFYNKGEYNTTINYTFRYTFR